MKVHILKGGRALCGKSGVPGSWTDDDKWVSYEDDPSMLAKVNCPGCLPGVPEDEPQTYEKRRPEQVTKDDLAFCPDKPTRFWVGAKTWHKDESKFVVTRGKDWPESVTVSCLDDPQIIFPAAERWRRRTAWDVIGATEHTIPMSDERLAELRWHLRRMVVYRVRDDFWSALDAAKELITEVDRLRDTPEEAKASMRIDGS